MEEEEVLDWGDDLRQDEEDGEDVISLAGTEDESSLQKEAPESTTTSSAAVSTAPGINSRTKASRFSTLPTADVSADKGLPPIPVSQPSKPAGRIQPSASLSSVTSRASTASLPAPVPSIISVTSHPSLPPKPSEAITQAAEAADREARKRERERERESMLSAVSLRPRGSDSTSAADNLPPGWELRESRSNGDKYYYNHLTQATSWSKPEAPASRIRGRSATPPRRSDDRGRDERYRDSRRDGDSDTRGSRRRSRSSSRGRDSYRPRDTDKRPEKSSFATGEWDRWRPEDDEVIEKPSKSNSDRTRAGHSTSIKPPPPSLPSRPSFDRSPPRRASSRERTNARDSHQRYAPKPYRNDDNHWSPPRQSPDPPSPRPTQRDLGPRDDDRSFLDIERSDNSRRGTQAKSRSRTPPPHRSPTMSRRAQSPSLSTFSHHNFLHPTLASYSPPASPLSASPLGFTQVDVASTLRQLCNVFLCGPAIASVPVAMVCIVHRFNR